MRIGMILNGNYPNDIRVRKEAETLSEFHQVFVLCKRNEGEPEYEKINGVHIYRKIVYKSITHEGIIDVIASVRFIHPIFKKKLPLFIKETNVQVLHIHDLPLAKTAYLLAKKHKLHTVLDLHENYPAALLTWFAWRKSTIIRLKNKLFFSYQRWRKYESEMIKKVDNVIVVVDEMKKRLLHQHNIDARKIVVVPNAEKISFADNFKNKKVNYYNGLKDKFIISYVGGFGPHRGLHTAIKAMKYVKNKIPNALLVLIGPANNDVLEHLKNLTDECGVNDCVLIKGKESFDNVINIMKSSDVNIIPHISNEHTESAVPHKLYQILLSKKPLLVSNCAPMKRIVDNNAIGTVFEANNSKDLAEKIVDIKSNYPTIQQKAAKGYEMALYGELNWENKSKELLKMYEELTF